MAQEGGRRHACACVTGVLLRSCLRWVMWCMGDDLGVVGCDELHARMCVAKHTRARAHGLAGPPSGRGGGCGGSAERYPSTEQFVDATSRDVTSWEPTAQLTAPLTSRAADPPQVEEVQVAGAAPARRCCGVPGDGRLLCFLFYMQHKQTHHCSSRLYLAARSDTDATKTGSQWGRHTHTSHVRVRSLGLE